MLVTHDQPIFISIDKIFSVKSISQFLFYFSGQGQNLPPPPGPPPQQPPPGWNNNNIDDFGDNNRKRPKDRRKNKNKNQISPSLPPEAIGSLAPGQNPPVQGPTWGTNVGAINDEEAKSMSKKRQFGYAIMACAVVALAVLMVSVGGLLYLL